MTATSLKALGTAHKFARDEDWKKATLCLLMAMHIDEKPMSISSIQQEFAYLGFKVERPLVRLCLEALHDDGLVDFA